MAFASYKDTNDKPSILKALIDDLHRRHSADDVDVAIREPRLESGDNLLLVDSESRHEHEARRIHVEGVFDVEPLAAEQLLGIALRFFVRYTFRHLLILIFPACPKQPTLPDRSEDRSAGQEGDETG